MLDVELYFPGRLIPTYDLYLRERGNTRPEDWWVYERGYTDAEEAKQDVRKVFKIRKDVVARIMVISAQTTTYSTYHPDFTV